LADFWRINAKNPKLLRGTTPVGLHPKCVAIRYERDHTAKGDRTLGAVACQAQ
jgi:hypothetical protein